MELVERFKGVPVKMWLDDLEQSARQQAINVSEFPDTFKHVALMPDSHAGMGVPIGCVFATENTVIPNAVGVDIGCGMTAVSLNIAENQIREDHKFIEKEIRERGILSVRREKRADVRDVVQAPYSSLLNEDILANATKQLGTLGGGNHFIEFQRDKHGSMWLMIHSGSRNLGQQIGKHYDKLAKEENKANFSSVPPSHKLAFLQRNTPNGQSYLMDMRFAVEYAKRNRLKMINDILDILKVKSKPNWGVANGTVIDCAHNYAAMENHFGKNVLVHRKGATFAGENILGLIPGSQGTNSYIVRGKGNKESFNSCSHGAGRFLSRSRAKEILDLEFEKYRLADINVIHSLNSRGNLDEAPGAYKDIDIVMDNQEDLVEVVNKLAPVFVIKN